MRRFSVALLLVLLSGCHLAAAPVNTSPPQTDIALPEECCETTTHHHFDKQKVLQKLHETRKQIDEAIAVLRARSLPSEQPW